MKKTVNLNKITWQKNLKVMSFKIIVLTIKQKQVYIKKVTGKTTKTAELKTLKLNSLILKQKTFTENTQIWLQEWERRLLPMLWTGLEDLERYRRRRSQPVAGLRYFLGCTHRGRFGYKAALAGSSPERYELGLAFDIGCQESSHVLRKRWPRI